MASSKQFFGIPIGFLLLALIAVGLFRTPITAASNCDGKLIGWWRFNEGSGILAADSSGLGNNALIEGLAIFTDDALQGYALDFKDWSAAAIVPHSSVFEPVTGTIEAWIKIDELQDSDIIEKTTDLMVRSNRTGSFTVYGIRITKKGRAVAYVLDDDPRGPTPWAFATSPPRLITPGDWHHLAMRWDNNTVAIFVDGVLRHATAYEPIPGTGLSYHGSSDLGLGVGTAWAIPGAHEFVGKLDGVRFYSCARSEGEIFNDFVARGQ